MAYFVRWSPRGDTKEGVMTVWHEAEDTDGFLAHLGLALRGLIVCCALLSRGSACGNVAQSRIRLLQASTKA